MTKKSDLLKAAAREKKFSTLAAEEAKGAASRAQHSKGANRSDNRMEAKIDADFAKARAKIATAYKKKAAKA